MGWGYASILRNLKIGQLEIIWEKINNFIADQSQNCSAILTFAEIVNELNTPKWKTEIPAGISVERFAAMILSVWKGNVNRLSLCLETGFTS